VLDGPPTEVPSVVVFTAQFGRADLVMPPTSQVHGVEFLVLTDEPMRVPRPWRIREVEIPHGISDPRLKNRWCKLHASEILADFDVSLYVDTHIQVVGDLGPLLGEFLRSGATVGLLRHPHSRSVEDEVARGVRTGRIGRSDHAANWPTQLERHCAAGFSDDLGVYYATVVMRRHRGDRIAELEHAWWDDLSHGVLRDQVALPFALWSTGVPHQIFLLPWSLEPYFRRWPHLPRWTLRERVLRNLDCRVAERPMYRWVLRGLRPRQAMRAFLARRTPGPSRVSALNGADA